MQTFKNSVPTSNRTRHVNITKVNSGVINPQPAGRMTRERAYVSAGNISSLGSSPPAFHCCDLCSFLGQLV
jgi:hypothetical protein